ncbi:MAG: ATP-dependent helicase [Deltaproteobacteria bacterium]|nr:MAG: ATP-dependent helicase [Deltaproteobacteria bacterium]
MKTFAELGLSTELLEGINKLGFKTPTPVQEEVIPRLAKLEDDLVALSQTGTGKTAAFGLPLIQMLDQKQMQTQALILCPTRELCVQVHKDLASFSHFLPKTRIVAVYGGASIISQSRQLHSGAQIIVATPGRLLAFIRQGDVNIKNIRAVILDEADEMLQMGFQDDLNAILAATPETKKTVLFSATMPQEVTSIAKRYMKDPVEVTIGERNQGIENVRHIYYMVAAKNRYPTLKRIADSNPDIYAIIFCRTRQETRDIAAKLIDDGYNADALHGELAQGQRDHVMQKFRRRNIKLLVATDVAARGLDVKNLSHVINYNLPDDVAAYTHRSGRTGRAGKEGISIAIAHLREKYKIKQIERRLKRKFELGRIPSGQEICQQRMLHYLDELKTTAIDSSQIEPFLPAIMESLAPLEREELVKRFVLSEFSQLLNYYRNAPDLNDKQSESRGRREPSSGRDNERRDGKSKTYKNRDSNDRGSDNERFSRFHINVGKRDGINPGRLIGEINDASVGGPRIHVGRIDIQTNCSLIEADTRYAKDIIKTFSSLMINGRKVQAKIADDKERMTPRSDRSKRPGRPSKPHPIRSKRKNNKTE